ncbi:hypothetical protein U1Q18_037509 [Sarracenia purpurea var. burkii]
MLLTSFNIPNPDPESLLATPTEIRAYSRRRPKQGESDAGVELRHGWRDMSLATRARSIEPSPKVDEWRLWPTGLGF